MQRRAFSGPYSCAIRISFAYSRLRSRHAPSEPASVGLNVYFAAYGFHVAGPRTCGHRYCGRTSGIGPDYYQNSVGLPLRGPYCNFLERTLVNDWLHFLFRYRYGRLENIPRFGLFSISHVFHLSVASRFNTFERQKVSNAAVLVIECLFLIKLFVCVCIFKRIINTRG